jgi:hypothetical protein
MSETLMSKPSFELAGFGHFALAPQQHPLCRKEESVIFVVAEEDIYLLLNSSNFLN